MINPDRIAFLDQIGKAARAQGASERKGSDSIVDLLKSGNIIWQGNDGKESKDCLAARERFCIERIGGSLNLKFKDAESLFRASNKTYDDAQKRAYNAAKSAWSYAAMQAGMPPRKGPARTIKSADEKAAEKAAAEFRANAEIVVSHDDKGAVRTITPKADSINDVARFALAVSGMLRNFENQNAKTINVDYRGVFDAFVNGVRAIANPSLKPKDETRKPRQGAKPGKETVNA